jgi:catechol-2,3-dioxygenase
MKLTIHTIILFVKEVDMLKSFYKDLLLLEVIEEIATEWVLLKAGSCNIGLHKMSDQFVPAAAGENNTKIVFEVAEELTVLREQLLSKNVSLGKIKTFDNYPYWLCDGTDPEGNVFQLKQRKK